MLLSLMTYARIDSFRYFLGMEAQFESYMNSLERKETNKAAKQWYETTRAPRPKDPNDRKPPRDPQKKSSASSRLSFRIFVDQKMREKDEAAFKRTSEWAKKLMIILYGNREFFAVEYKKNPAFLDQILESLEKATEGLLTGKLKLDKATQLSNLNLDESVSEAFYYMLKGCPNAELKKDQTITDEKKEDDIVKSPSDTDDDDRDDNDAMEYSKDGYDSLLNYISLQNTTKIRVFLASRPLLAAIFGDVSTADAIIVARQGLYRAVVNGSLDPKDASDQFADLLKGYTQNFDEGFLDFTVSKTNPAGYR